jgi:hypothetical protein
MRDRRSKITPIKASRILTIAESHPEYTLHFKQIPLFENPINGNGNGQGTFRDPAFVENKNLPVHRWVPWIAGYSASFVDSVISRYLCHPKTALVLDPFCGVGTTLLQAALRGHEAVGFEINPYPALAARAKLNSPMVNLSEFDALLVSMRKASAKWQTGPPPKDIQPPPLKSRIPFFSPNVERQALQALVFINKIESEAIADLLRVAFGAVMVSFSNYSYEPSLGSRPAVGKPLIENADVGQILLNKLFQMRADISWIQEEVQGKRLGRGKVINSDFFSTNTELATGSVDLMVTSPPYMNNYHYVRNTRPQLYWLKFVSSPAEQRYLEINNFGQYWQTVREIEPITLVFEHRELEEILRKLRETRNHKGAYGGPGWANYVASYFNDCFRFTSILKRVLGRGGVGVIVVGNSIIQGINIRTEKIMGEIGAIQGLILEGVYCIREKRVGASITQSSVRQGERNKATLSESAVVVRKR